MSVEVTSVTVPKSHGNTSMYVDTVINFAKNTTYYIHTYILHTTYIHTYYIHTMYRMSDDIVSFWTQFRRDKNQHASVSTTFFSYSHACLPANWHSTIDIEKRSQNSYTSPCNGVVSHGATIRVFAGHTCRNKSNKMRPQSSRAMRRFMRVYLQAQTAVHTHLTNHGYFDLGKKLNTPNLSPMSE